MSTPVSSLKSLGPAFEAACTQAGIMDAETLRDLGAHESYRKLLISGMKPHFIWYCVLNMTLQGRPWNDCKGKEKEALRAKFDALKAACKASPIAGLVADLDVIGVRVRPDDLKPL